MNDNLNDKDGNMEVSKGQFLVYQAEDGKLKLDVRFEDESVWLSQRLMAALFQKDVRTISEHIQNVYDEGELVPEATIRKFRIVQKEGKRDVARMVDFYNLDMIISVGYRVKSHVATRFRIWATQQLTEFINEKFHTQRLSESAKQLSDFDHAVNHIESTKEQKKNNDEG
ncbi:MAG: hypothetical protein EOM20_08340 [Spartobacteria bacterium]|nr:hypothetical protein [Spartobacteria bacterium]